MPRGWIVQLRHFLDDDGEVPAILAVRRHAAFFGSIVVAMSAHPGGGTVETAVRCRKSPQRRVCLGLVYALLDRAQGEIHWQCPVCGDWGVISGWEGTWYDRSGPRREAESGADHAAPTTGSAPQMSPDAQSLWEALGPAARLRVLNNAYCAACGGERAMALTGGRVERGELVLDGLCTTCGSEVGRLIETGDWSRS